MMNKKAEANVDDLIWKNVIGFSIIAVFVIIMGTFAYRTWNGASVWEEYYTQQIALLINNAAPGDNITLDIQKATEVAQNNGVTDFYHLFTFDNANKQVCVGLIAGKKTCIYYFNNVDVIDASPKFGVPGNILNFRIISSQRNIISGGANA